MVAPACPRAHVSVSPRALCLGPARPAPRLPRTRTDSRPEMCPKLCSIVLSAGSKGLPVPEREMEARRGRGERAGCRATRTLCLLQQRCLEML